MFQLIQTIYSGQTDAGRLIVGVIVFLTILGMANTLKNLFFWLPGQRKALKDTGAYFNKGMVVHDPNTILPDLERLQIPSNSLVYLRLRQLLENEGAGTTKAQQHMADIIAGQESTRTSFSRHIQGALVGIGLIGTILGLSMAITEIRPMIGKFDDVEELSKISATIGETLSGMSTAFTTTLAGLLGSLVLGLFNWSFSARQTIFLANLEELIVLKILPRLCPDKMMELAPILREFTEGAHILKLATDENMSLMGNALKQLTDSSWDAKIEQQYRMIDQLEITGENLATNLGIISANQGLIKDAMASFNIQSEKIENSISEGQAGIQKALGNNLPNMVQKLDELNQALEQRSRQDQQELDSITSTLQAELQSNHKLISEFKWVLSEQIEQNKLYQQAIQNSQESIEKEMSRSTADMVNAHKNSIPHLEQFVGRLIHQMNIQASSDRDDLRSILNDSAAQTGLMVRDAMETALKKQLDLREKELEGQNSREELVVSQGALLERVSANMDLIREELVREKQKRELELVSQATNANSDALEILVKNLTRHLDRTTEQNTLLEISKAMKEINQSLQITPWQRWFIQPLSTLRKTILIALGKGE